MKYNIAGKTDVGLARTNNEDNLISFMCPLGQVVAVCDGMGGENGGETASSLAVSIIQDILENQKFNSPEEGIVSACMAANQGILFRASQNPELTGMGSTCVMAIINGNKIYYGSIGDSRIYHYIPGKGLSQITKDQSYVQTLVDAGEITQEEAEHHPQKNEITNALGYEGMQPPVVGSVTAVAGAKLLLCSDGLSGMVPDASLLHVLKREEWSPEDKAEKLINLANEAGGQDNITVQIVEWVSGKSTVAAPSGVPSAKSSNKTANIVIILAILALLGCGAFVGWKMMHKDSTTVVDKKSSTPKTSQPTTSQPVSTTTTTTEKHTVVEKQNVVVEKKTIVDKKAPQNKNTGTSGQIKNQVKITPGNPIVKQKPVDPSVQADLTKQEQKPIFDPKEKE